MHSFKNTSVSKIQWFKKPSDSKNRIALLIPQFNEASFGNFEDRLDYFNSLCERFPEIDVIMIDDGSTDDSCCRLHRYLNIHPGGFYCAAVYPNAQKVGALHLTAQNITHDYIILSDFDTDLENLEFLFGQMDKLNEERSTMGCYFRMVPYEGRGLVFKFQQFEYMFARIYYRFHSREKSVPVMPGAGCCYSRSALLEIYSNHSGVRNGEDREATAIGLKLGYKTFYLKDTLALTRPPLTMKKLIQQRKRWYLGYLETLLFQQSFYWTQLIAGTRFGLRTIQDATSVILLLLLPLEVFLATMTLGDKIIELIVWIYSVSVAYYMTLLVTSPKESKEMKGNLVFPVLLYPLFWLLISFLSWWKAMISFMTRSYPRSRVQQESKPLKIFDEVVSEL